MIEYVPLMPYRERYAELSHEPLRVALWLKLSQRMAQYDALHLDNLLARMVVEDATEGKLLPEERDAYLLPTPLECAWRDSCGLPLWKATAFRAIDGTSDVTYWHKRLQPGNMTRTKSGTFSVRPTKGRWMERRMPLPTIVADHWEAECVGNRAEVERLLARAAWVGKRRTSGFGEVDRWTVESCEAFSFVADGRLLTDFPAMAIDALAGWMPGEPPGIVGWTPPQWKTSLFAPGWRTGTPVEAMCKG